MPITPHNGEPHLKWSSSYSHSFPVCNDSAFVRSANGDGSALTSKATSNLINDDTYQFICAGNCVIHPDK